MGKKKISLEEPPKVEYPQISEKILFQCKYKDHCYLGFFTLDVCKYIYYLHMNRKLNNPITHYMRLFLDVFLGRSDYTLYLISKVPEKGESNGDDVDVMFDTNISVDMVFHQYQRIFHFQDFQITQDLFEKVEGDAHIWNFIDYDEDELPFTGTVPKKLTEKAVKELRALHFSYSPEFCQAKYQDASSKSSYWNRVISYLHKSKSNHHNYSKMVESCELRRATQICRKHKYDDENLFLFKHNFIAIYLDVPSDVPSYFEYEDDLDYEVKAEFKSTCGKYHLSGMVATSGSLQRNVEWEYDIEECKDVDASSVKELYTSLFKYFVSSDI